jgi:hypothetical protein
VRTVWVIAVSYGVSDKFADLHHHGPKVVQPLSGTRSLRGRAQRRQYIPKPDGRQGPLGIAALEHRIGDRPMRSRFPARAWFISALLFLIATVLMFSTIEGALRLTDYEYLTHPSIQEPPDYFRADSDLGIDLAPHRPPATFVFRGPSFETFTNSLGCFDYERPIEQDYILAVGDSSTWGYAPLEEKWTTRLEELSGRQILKCGVNGTGPKYQQIKARKVIDKVGWAPDVIVVLYDKWNDFNDDVVFPGYTIYQGHRVENLESVDLRTGEIARLTSRELQERYERFIAGERSLKRFLIKNFVTVALARKALSELSRGRTEKGPLLRSRYDFPLWVDTTTYPWVEQAFVDHLENLRTFRGMAERYGAKFVLIGYDIPHKGLHARLRDFLSTEMPYFYDIGEEVERVAQGRRVHHRFDEHHWNRLGNGLAADAIHQHLKAAGVL